MPRFLRTLGRLPFLTVVLLVLPSIATAALSLSYNPAPGYLANQALAPLLPTLAGNNAALPTTFAVTTGALPAGLSLRHDGAIVGTPTAVGGVSAKITATNGGATASFNLWLSIRTVTVTYALPVFIVGQPVASMAIPHTKPALAWELPGTPTTLAVTGGSVPPGLAIDPADGSFAGTPTAPGVYTFEITATNGPHSAARSFCALVTATDLAAAPHSVLFSDPGVDRFRPASSTGDYYVDSVNGLDSHDGRTPATAWKNLAKIPTAKLAPGNVIHLARGSHWPQQTLYLRDVQGTAQQPVVVQAYGTGAPPTISDSYPPWSTTQRYPGVYIAGTAAHLVVLDLRIQDNVATDGISIGPATRHIVVAGNEILRCYSGLSAFGDNSTVVSNYIHDIYVPGEKECGVGIWYCGSNVELAWNRIANCRSLTPDSVGGGALEFYGHRAATGYDFVSENIRIHHNLLLNTANFMEMYGNASRLVVDHNLYLWGASHAFLPHWDNWGNQEAFGHVCTYDLLVANNTFVARPDPEPRGWGFFTLLWDSNHIPDPALNSLVVRNNIFSTNATIASRNPLGASFAHTHNLYHFTGAGKLGDAWFTLDPTERLANPLFAAPALGDCRLTAASPARNTGVPALAPEDLARARIPATGVSDLGAYAFTPDSTLAVRTNVLERSGFTELVFGPTALGSTYRLSVCTDLKAGNWTPLGAPLDGTGGYLTVVDPAATSAHRFYRVQANPP